MMPAPKSTTSIQSAVQIVVEGPHNSKVTAATVQTDELRGLFAETLQLVLKDRAAFESFVDFARQMEARGRMVWPERDSFTEVNERRNANLAKYGTEKDQRFALHGRKNGRYTNGRYTDNGLERGLR